MEKIYLDNACTSNPKVPGLADVFVDYYTKYAVNVGRSSYSEANRLDEEIFDVRSLVAAFFGAKDSSDVVFTKNITESLNMVIKGFLHPGDHVIVSSMEHNAVMRPLVQLEKIGVAFSRIPCDCEGNLIFSKFDSLVKNNTKALICTSASNVCGTCMPLGSLGLACKKHGIKFIVDSAQIAGFSKIDVRTMNIDALCFTGHKGLLGPTGIGGVVFSNGMEKVVEPLVSGGTGSMSDSEEIPQFMPDKFEAGTMNVPGILGLGKSIRYVSDIGLEKIKEKELELTAAFIQGLKELECKGLLKIIGRHDVCNRCAVVSISVPDKDLSDIAYKLDSEFGIMVRVGLHCAPSAHKTLNTFPAGTIRFSFGYSNTLQEVKFAVKALETLLWK